MMPVPVFRIFLFCVALLCSGMNSTAGVASYTDHGTIDFDKALQLLNPYGTWSKIDDQWAYTPLDREAPYTNGRWLYTEYGWYWKGNHAHSWLTEHYGFWKRGADKVWSWYPGTSWLSEIVEFRATPTHIGWRSGAVDRDGNYIEAPEDRYAKPEEWTFVTKAQFAGPITPGIAVKADAAENLLLDSTDCAHAYLTYRPIERPGPHPADFVALCKDGEMFSPLQHEEMAPPPAIPGLPPPTPVAPAVAANVAKMTGTNAPSLVGMGDDAEPAIDKRQVKYWVTMSLPTYWTPPPTDSKPDEIYLFRPDFYQDDDGIARRITLWFNPSAKTSLKDIFAETAAQTKPDAAADSGGPAQAAVPATAAKPHNPFRSPLDSSFPSSESHPSEASSKANSTTNAPSGLADPSNGK
jgi:hypothetical protein